MTLDAQLLTALRSAEDGAVSTKDLTSRLKIPRSSVAARIAELRSLGYEIVSTPHDGFRLVDSPDLLHADDLVARLGKVKVIGREIQVFEETNSTNDLVDKLGRNGSKEGVVVFAESQTKGRGRLGRKWVSPPKKGLWFSILLRPGFSPQACTRLTIMSATGLVRAIAQETSLTPEVKWPNDILIGGKKVAGVLTELSAEVDRVKYVVLGIGLDVNLVAADFPADLRKLATSLRIATGRTCSRPSLAATVLRELDRDYGRIKAEEFTALADEWEASCTTLGRDVVIKTGDRVVSGRAEALDSDGALLIRTQHGRLERLIGGDLTMGR